MTERGPWIVRLETELARELGQPVSAVPGGDAPDPAGSLVHTLELPGTCLTLAADAQGLARLLAEGRVVEPGTADDALVQELWSGILASVAARMGGTASAASGNFPAHPCRLQLGEASVRMAFDAEERAGSNEASPEARREGVARVQNDGDGRYELLLEVDLDAVVRFGSRSLELRDLLELGPGDVVELDRQVTDPVDLIVGDRIVARGEVVLVDGNFGLRITDVAEPVRRLESIPCLH